MRANRFEKEFENMLQGFKQFATQYPDSAQSLGLFDKNGPSDPEIRYLLESICLMHSDLAAQINQNKTKLVDTIERHTQCIWADPVPPAAIMQIYPCNYSSPDWPITINEPTMFGTNDMPLRTFSPIQIYPWQVKSIKYTDGGGYFKESAWAVVIEITAPNNQVWNLDSGIELYVDANPSADAIKLISSVLSAKEAAIYIDNTGEHSVNVDLARCDEALMEYQAHPADARMREMLTFIEKYLFLNIPIKSWIGNTLKIILPLNVESSLELVDLNINSFRLNCIPVVALDVKMIDPIIYDGTRSIHNVHVPFGWSACSFKSVHVSTKNAEDNIYVSRTEDGLTMIFSELSDQVTVSGTVWAMPEAKILAGPEYKCIQYPVYGKLRHNCSDIIPIPPQETINLWATQISSVYASSGHIAECFLNYAPRVATKKIARVIREISYLYEDPHPVFTKLGWINGSMITLQTKRQNIEAILICRILLCALRHKASINTLVGLRVIDESGYELMSWAPEVLGD